MDPRIESKDEFEQNPAGWAQLWTVEMKSAKDALKKWTERGDKVVRRFLDDRDGLRLQVGEQFRLPGFDSVNAGGEFGWFVAAVLVGVYRLAGER